MVEKPPRSKRHSQEDDDAQRPEGAEHMFDASGLAIPMTHGLRPDRENAGDFAGPSRTGVMNDGENVSLGGENVPEAEVRAATREPENDVAVWLEVDYEEDEDNIAFNDGAVNDGRHFPSM